MIQKNTKFETVSKKGFDLLFFKQTQKAEELLTAWAHFFGKYHLIVDDFISKCMLYNKHKPYRDEIKNIASACALNGVYSLNFNRYLGCTTAVQNGTLFRTLDVTAPALGECLQVVEKHSTAGNYYNLTWAGFVGVATAVAPNRFAIAYNEAPFSGSPVINILKIVFNNKIPPLWLTRYVLENCKTYEEARKMLCETKLCTNSIFTLASADKQGCVIERTRSEYVIYDINDEKPFVSAGNHWQNFEFAGKVALSKKTSLERCMHLNNLLKNNKKLDNFNWLTSPIAGNTTRFACELNPSANNLNDMINIRIL